VQPHWASVNAAVRGALHEVSLASLTVSPTQSACALRARS